MPKPDTLPDPAATLAALGVARKAMIDVLRSVRLFGPAYCGADMVISAIDVLAEIITGEREYFSIGGSVGPGRREAMLKGRGEPR